MHLVPRDLPLVPLLLPVVAIGLFPLVMLPLLGFLGFKLQVRITESQYDVVSFHRIDTRATDDGGDAGILGCGNPVDLFRFKRAQATDLDIQGAARYCSRPKTAHIY